MSSDFDKEFEREYNARSLGASEAKSRLPAATGGMSDFIDRYGPAAERAAAQTGNDPALYLAQWGLETGWGKSVIPGTNNLGNIKDFSGSGVLAKDNQTGSRDKYRRYETPEQFADDFASLLNRRYGDAVGVGSDVDAFANGLKRGGYAEDARYVDKIKAAYNMLSGRIPAKSSQNEYSEAFQQATGYTPVSGEEIGTVFGGNEVGSRNERQELQAASDESPLSTSLKRGFKGLTHSAGLAVDNILGDSESAARRIAEKREFDRDNPAPSSSAKFASDWDSVAENDYSGMFATVLKNPAGSFNMMLEQTPNSLPGMAFQLAAGIGSKGLMALGPVGAAAGIAVQGLAAFAGNFLPEGGAFIEERLHKDGVDTNNPAAVKAWIEENRGENFKGGATKAAVISSVDAVTGWMGMKMMAGPSVRFAKAEKGFFESNGINVTDGNAIKAARSSDAYKAAMQPYAADLVNASEGFGMFKRGVGATLFDSVGEGVGEYAGSYAATGEASVKEAILEGLMSVGQSTGMAAGQYGIGKLSGPSQAMEELKSIATPPVQQPNSPLTNAAGLSNHAAQQQAAAADPFAPAVDQISERFADRTLFSAIRENPSLGPDALNGILGSYRIATNTNLEPSQRQAAIDRLSMFFSAYDNQPNFTFGSATQEAGLPVVAGGRTQRAEQGLLTDQTGEAIDGQATRVDDPNAFANEFNRITGPGPAESDVVQNDPVQPNSPTSGVETSDLSYTSDGMFTTFLPNTKAGESAWNTIAAEDGTGKVPNQHAASVIQQLKDAGYSVGEQTAQSEVSDEELSSLMAEDSEQQEAPAPKTSGRLKPLEDGRVSTHADSLRAMAPDAGWAEEGGKLIRLPDGTNTRTKWVPRAEWFMAGMLNSPEESAAAVEKAIAGQPMNAKEKRHVQAMMDFLDSVGAGQQFDGNEESDMAESIGYDEESAENQETIDMMADLIDIETPGTFQDETEAMRALGFTEEEINEVTRGKQASIGGSDEATAEAASGEAEGSVSEGNSNADSQGASEAPQSEGDFDLTGQTNEEAAAEEAAKPNQEDLTKQEIDAQVDGFSLAKESQPKPQGVQTGLFTADGRVSAEAKPALVTKRIVGSDGKTVTTVDNARDISVAELPNHKFFTFKKTDGTFSVTEESTGASVVTGATEEEAIANLKKLAGNVGSAGFDAAIAKLKPIDELSAPKRSLDAIKRKYKGGKASEVKTLEGKIGDEYLANHPAIEIVNVSTKSIDDSDVESMQKNASASIKKQFDDRGGYVVNIPSGIAVTASNKNIGHAVNLRSEKHRPYIAHFAVAEKIAEIIESAVLADSYLSKKDAGPYTTIHRLYGAANIDGSMYRVKMTLKQSSSDELSDRAAWFYDHELTTIEEITPAKGVTSQPEVVVIKPEAKREGGGEISVRDLLSGVKRDSDGTTFMLSIPKQKNSHEENLYSKNAELKHPKTLDEFYGFVDAGYRAHFDYAGVDGRTVWIEKTDKGWVLKAVDDDNKGATITKGGAGLSTWDKYDAMKAAEANAEYRFTDWKPLVEENKELSAAEQGAKAFENGEQRMAPASLSTADKVRWYNAWDKANISDKKDDRVWNDTRVPGLRHDTTSSPVRTWRYGAKEFAGTEILPEFPQFFNKELAGSLPQDVLEDAQKMIRERLDWYNKEFGIIGDDKFVPTKREGSSAVDSGGNSEMAKRITIAADSIEKLRKVDVERVLTQGNLDRDAMAAYIKTKRPDLAGEVDDVMSEISVPAKQEAPGTRINGAKEKAAADRLEQLHGQMSNITNRNSREGNAKAAIRSIIEELRKPKTVVSIDAILQKASDDLMKNYGAFAGVIDDVSAELSSDKKPESEMDSLMAEMGQAIGELASILGVKANLTPEEESKIIPVMSKIFRIAAKMGYIKFKEAARFVMDTIRKQAPDAADKIEIKNLQAAYVNLNGFGADPEIGNFTSIEELQAERDELNGKIEDAEKRTAVNPTDAQKEAGNYVKGKFQWNGLTVSIETPKDTERSGVGEDGQKWSVTVPVSYGYFNNTVGADKEHLDVYIGDKPESNRVYVINQTKPDSTEFDEHKVMIGFQNEQDAQVSYLLSFEGTFGGSVLGSVAGPYTVEYFKMMVDGGRFQKAEPITDTVAWMSPRMESSQEESVSLDKFGLKVTRSQTRNGTPTWEVSGNTKDHMAVLKGLGGKWYGPKKVWSFYDRVDPSKAIFDALNSKEEAAIIPLNQITVSRNSVVNIGEKSEDQQADEALAELDQQMNFGRQLLECLAA